MTLRLPETLLVSIEAEARQLRTTKSELVRRRLEEGRAGRLSNETWPAAEEILKQAWKARVPARRRSYRNPRKQKLLEAMQREKQRRR